MCSDKWQDEGSRNDYSKQKLAKKSKQPSLNFRRADTCVLGGQRTSACTCPHISQGSVVHKDT